MKLHELKPPAGARTERRRVGRGHGSGRGKTAGRGTKGQLSRSGGKVPAWFEGGQGPVTMRFPHKRGFKRPHRIEYQIVNLWQLARRFSPGATVGPDDLAAGGLIDLSTTRPRPVKVLGDGRLHHALTVRAHSFSASARAAIEAAGGAAVEVPS